jgi:hypothetical protein
MSNTLQERVVLPQGRRSPGGLLVRGLPLPDGWTEGGIVFRASGCSEPVVLSACEVSDRTGVRPGENGVFEPIFISASAACSLLSQIGSTNMASDRLEATSEWALGRLLATGLGSNNPSFADATNVHSADTGDIPADVVAAVSCLEQAAADLGFGAEIVMHAPPRAAAFLKSLLLIEDDTHESPSGHPWIISSGYPVEAESGEDTIVTIWATGTVWAGVSDAYVLDDGRTGKPPVNWRMNLDEAYAQRLGLAAFDPCLALSASFVVPACIGGS